VAGNNNSTLLIIILMILAFGGTFWVRHFLTKRGILNVVKIFYQHNALRMNGAKTLRELGLERADLLQRMVKPRDYKQTALQLLIKRGVIHVTDGKLYMVEENLDHTFRRKSNDGLPQGRS
jgi:hypothetical protein